MREQLVGGSNIGRSGMHVIRQCFQSIHASDQGLVVRLMLFRILKMCRQEGNKQRSSFELCARTSSSWHFHAVWIPVHSTLAVESSSLMSGSRDDTKSSISARIASWACIQPFGMGPSAFLIRRKFRILLETLKLDRVCPSFPSAVGLHMTVVAQQLRRSENSETRWNTFCSDWALLVQLPYQINGHRPPETWLQSHSTQTFGHHYSPWRDTGLFSHKQSGGLNSECQTKQTSIFVIQPFEDQQNSGYCFEHH